MTTILAVLGTIAIIAIQVVEYNLTEIQPPKAGSFEEDLEPPHLLNAYSCFSTH
ncbi:hypothetical protein ACSFB8_02080 [Enterococcus faecalis]